MRARRARGSAVRTLGTGETVGAMVDGAVPKTALLYQSVTLSLCGRKYAQMNIIGSPTL